MNFELVEGRNNEKWCELASKGERRERERERQKEREKIKLNTHVVSPPPVTFDDYYLID